MDNYTELEPQLTALSIEPAQENEDTVNKSEINTNGIEINVDEDEIDNVKTNTDEIKINIDEPDEDDEGLKIDIELD